MQLRLDLHALHGVIVVNVLDLVTEDESQFVFAVHLPEKAQANHYVSAWQREGVDQVRVGIEKKHEGNLAVRMGRYPRADLVHIVLNSRRACVLLAGAKPIGLHQVSPDADLVGVG